VILAWVILALSLAMVFFYFQATCLKILRRPFDQEYFQSIANVIGWSFRHYERRWRSSVSRSIIVDCAEHSKATSSP